MHAGARGCRIGSADSIQTRRFRRRTFLRFVISDSVLIVDLTAADWSRSLELVGQYLDRPLGLVDASIVAVAERLGISDLATMNGRDFYLVRPGHVESFTLLPDGLARRD